MHNYISKALETESVVEQIETNTRLLHAVMGICTEVGELVCPKDRINVIEELGDICWYIAVLSDVRQIDYIEKISFEVKVPNLETSYEHMVNLLCFYPSELLDALKKNMFYGKPIDFRVFDSITDRFIKTLSNIIRFQNKSFEAILNANIEKLNSKNGRYKTGKFSKEEAINRDDKVERALLESSINQ
jgi:NTP pyrophosphatase (non-canonical NTP hydrolase)